MLYNHVQRARQGLKIKTKQKNRGSGTKSVGIKHYLASQNHSFDGIDFLGNVVSMFSYIYFLSLFANLSLRYENHGKGHTSRNVNEINSSLSEKSLHIFSVGLTKRAKQLPR